MVEKIQMLVINIVLLPNEYGRECLGIRRKSEKKLQKVSCEVLPTTGEGKEQQ